MHERLPIGTETLKTGMRKIKTKARADRTVRIVSARDARQLNLWKIGALAQEYQILPSTINFYTREGLLPEDARSVGGYRLYNRTKALQRLKSIEALQDKRMTIEEIKRHLG